MKIQLFLITRIKYLEHKKIIITQIFILSAKKYCLKRDKRQRF